MQPASAGPEKSSNLRRYGPLGAIVVVLLVVGGLVVLNGGGDDDGDEEASTDDSTQDIADVDCGDPAAFDAGMTEGEPELDDDGNALAPAPMCDMPVTYDEAVAAGTVDDYTWPDSCDTETGQVKLPLQTAPPCVPAFEGDNGGATSPGVTADKITIVRYVADQSSDLTAILGSMGADDTPEDQGATLQGYLDIYTSATELYGREIEIVDYNATGAAQDVVAAGADATQIAEELEPFAVIGGPQLDRGTFAQTLSDAGILCFECAGALPDALLREMQPFTWGPLPSPDQFLATLNAWVGNSELAGEMQGNEDAAVNAEFAGDPEYRDQPRKVGVIHFEQDPPIFAETQEANAEALDGVELIEPYVLDFATLPQKATELVSRFKSEGITSVVFLGDPLMPIYLTQAATEQEYFPEWIFTGTVLTDTNIFGRQYDPEQMPHAFGISQLAAPTTVDIQDTVTIWRWYNGEGTMPPAEAQYNIIAPRSAWLATALHMAGPNLTPATFARGLFRVPPSGGTALAPQVSFGNWGFFPYYDFLGVDDSAEIWWDPDVEAEDERGEVGMGVWRRAHNGERFINEEDAPLPAPFVEEDTVTVFDELPADEAPPEYPPPAGSPAAQ
jgi:hypothetical protein